MLLLEYGFSELHHLSLVKCSCSTGIDLRRGDEGSCAGRSAGVGLRSGLLLCVFCSDDRYSCKGFLLFHYCDVVSLECFQISLYHDCAIFIYVHSYIVMSGSHGSLIFTFSAITDALFFTEGKWLMMASCQTWG